MKIKYFKILVLLFVVSFFSCSEDSDLGVNPLDSVKLFATDNGNPSVAEVIALIYYNNELNQDDINEIRSYFFSNCETSLGCYSDLTVELYRTTGVIHREYWKIRRCDDKKWIHCPEDVKDAIEDGGIGEVF